MVRSYILTGFSLLLFTLIFSACGGGAEGYGVVLLSPNEDVVDHGTFVTVEKSSSISETYTITIPEESGSFEIDMWRVAFFDKKSGASKYADSYAQYRNLFAKNLRDGLAIRQKPDVTSPRLYKLRKGQNVKILDKIEEEVEVGSHTGHWYEVLTRDGVSGYSFDHYLEIYDADAAPVEDDTPDMRKIREILSRTYRPVDYEKMKENGRIDLSRFTEDYGFFPDPEEKRFRVRTFTYTHTFTYDEIEKQSESNYLFKGAGVELRTDDENHITLIYSREDQNYSPGFTLIEEIEEIRKKEIERREELMRELVEGGPSYHSSAYGTILFNEDGTFEWQRFDRLVPRIISSPDYSGGMVRFNHFVGPDIENEYTGAFALNFESAANEAPAGEEAPVFLYSLSEEKLTIEYVSAKNIEKKLVKRRNASPLIMVFFPES